MRTIPLGGKKAAGRVALVDDEDYEMVIQYRWHLLPGKRPDTVYAARSLECDGRDTTQKMNVLITGWPLTDHVNGDGLDNQRSNLRPATNAQNCWNRKQPRHARSQFKGVTPRGDRWAVQLQAEGRKLHLGVYNTELEAAMAYDAAARHHHGEFAYLNFPGTTSSPPLVTKPRLCVICRAFIDPIDFCIKCADLDQKCDEHRSPRRRADADTCSRKCSNALRRLPHPA